MQDKVCSPQTKNKDSEGMFGFRALREQSSYHMINQTSSNNFGVWIINMWSSELACLSRRL